MYPIDFLTCTMTDVIERSYVCHPSLFAEQLFAVGDIHRNAARTIIHPAARKSAEDMQTVAFMMAGAIGRGEFKSHDLSEYGPLEFSARIIAFGAACRLQCVSGSLASDIAARSDAVQP